MTNKKDCKINIFINSSIPNESRIAITYDNQLSFIDFEKSSQEHHKRGNIYLGTVTKIEASINALFVDYGANRKGFLPFKEVVDLYKKKMPEKTAKPKTTDETNDAESKAKEPSLLEQIKASIKVGQSLIVQIEKEEREREKKGAALTTNITLPGSSLVLMPYNTGNGGISKKADHAERDHMKETLDQLNNPNQYPIIIRTAGIGKPLEDLQWDLDMLVNLHDQITEAAKSFRAPKLLHKEANPVMRTVRDHLNQNVEKILVDNENIFTELSHFLNNIRPEFIDRLELYQNKNVSLFHHYNIDSQIDQLTEREITLPSGGKLSFGIFDAGSIIDVNSAKATSGKNIEETALQTNLEAATEIMRQVTLRKMDGIIIIDFIDMDNEQHKKKVELLIQKIISKDRAKVRFMPICELSGCMTLSRQRLGTPIYEANQTTCDHCDGSGFVNTIMHQGAQIMHRVMDAAMSESCGSIHVFCSIETGTYILNDKRDLIKTIEDDHNVSILIIPTTQYTNKRYVIKRFRQQEHTTLEAMETSTNDQTIDKAPEWHQNQSKQHNPVVTKQYVNQSKPTPKNQPGIFAQIWNSLFSSSQKSKPNKKETTKPKRTRQNNSGNKNTNQRRSPSGARSATSNNRNSNNRSGNSTRRSTSSSRRAPRKKSTDEAKS